MEAFKHRWYRVPRSVRRPIVMIVGSLICLAAALTGALPGPGGIPLFLVGIAVLATEFEWAQKVRDYILDILTRIGHQWQRHKVVGTILGVAGAAAGITMGIIAFRYF